MLFKGYIELNGKRPTHKFKDSKLKTLQEVTLCPSYGGVMQDDTILIDVDDQRSTEILLEMIRAEDVQCRVHRTSRGGHFLFTGGYDGPNRTGIPLACGITADVKSGRRHSYCALKVDGQEREVIMDPYVYDPLPAWMTPIRCAPAFEGMQEGDGRNQELFNYILNLQSEGLEKSDVRKAITLINDYVLSEPLPPTELDMVLRDEAFKENIFFDKQTFLFEKFAKFLVSELRIVKLEGQLHTYSEGVYLPGSRRIEKAMIQYIEPLRFSQRMETLKYIELLAEEASEPITNTRYICFENGIYDLKTNDLISHTPDIILRNKIPHNYLHETSSHVVDNVLDKLASFEPDVRTLMEEMIGYCFFRRNELRKAFILTGGRRRGKSTFIHMLSSVLGQANISNLDLSEIGEKFLSYKLFGKLANLGDDISSKSLTDPSILKKVISGESITTQQKHEQPFEFVNYSKLIFSANGVPRIKDDEDAMLDRLIMVPFVTEFGSDKGDFDPFIRDKLSTPEASEHLIRLGVKGLKNVLARQRFTNPKAVQDLKEEYELDNHPVLRFFQETPVDNIVHFSTRDVYLRYQVYCTENGIYPLSNRKFGKSLCEHYNLVSKVVGSKGKSQRVYMLKKNEGT